MDIFQSGNLLKKEIFSRHTVKVNEGKLNKDKVDKWWYTKKDTCQIGYFLTGDTSKMNNNLLKTNCTQTKWKNDYMPNRTLNKLDIFQSGHLLK